MKQLRTCSLGQGNPESIRSSHTAENCHSRFGQSPCVVVKSTVQRVTLAPAGSHIGADATPMMVMPCDAHDHRGIEPTQMMTQATNVC